MVALRHELGDDKVTRTGGNGDKRMLQESLRTRLDTYNRCERILSEKKATLASVRRSWNRLVST